MLHWIVKAVGVNIKLSGIFTRKREGRSMNFRTHLTGTALLTLILLSDTCFARATPLLLRAVAAVEDALASYVRRRKSRVEWVQRRSMELGTIPTAPSRLRNTALRERGDEAMRARLRPPRAGPLGG
jgi:hypothetical protein